LIRKRTPDVRLRSHRTLERSRPSIGRVPMIPEERDRAKTARLSENVRIRDVRDVQMRNVRNVRRRMRHQVLSTDRRLPSWEVRRGTRIARMRVELAYHATLSFEVEVRVLTRDNARINIKYVTKVTCHVNIIKCVHTFATEFTGPVHLQGQVIHSQQSSPSATLFSSFLYFLLLAGSSGFFN
jgi:hypothetical protein